MSNGKSEVEITQIILQIRLLTNVGFKIVTYIARSYMKTAVNKNFILYLYMCVISEAGMGEKIIM